MMIMERVSVELVELIVLVTSTLRLPISLAAIPVSRRSLSEWSAILCVLIVLSNLC